MHDHTKTLNTSQGPVTVKRCGCGGIHVCLGGISINLAEETAQFLKEELEKACSVNTLPRLVSLSNPEAH